MNKERIRRGMFLIVVNSIFAIICLFVFSSFTRALNIGYFISLIQANTQKFVLSFGLLLLIFLLTAKIQIKFYHVLTRKHPWIVPILKYGYIFSISLIASVIVNYYLQYFQMLKDPLYTTDWILNNTRIFYMGILYFLFMFLFAFSIIGNVHISSILTSAFLLLIGYIHYQKMNIRVEPLYPGDYKQIAQLKDVISMLSNVIFTEVLIAILIGVLLFIFACLLPKLKIKIWLRGLIFVLSLFMLYSYTNFPDTFMRSFVAKNNVNIIKWNQMENYETNGFLFGFISNLQGSSFEKPEDYTKQNVIKTAEKYADVSQSINSKPTQMPNIVFLMSESLWDPLKLDIKFSGDPLNHLRNLQNEHSYGQILSPSFTGATANVEFEALTGFTNLFIKEGVIPYQDFVSQKTFVPTIVSDLENKGYDTLAIHPFGKIFYKREYVYNTFGFNEFLHMDTVKYQETSLGGYISDESLSLEILDNLKNAERPLFIHAVSMQNHIPYNLAEKENKIKTSSRLTKQSRKVIEGYTEGVRRTDEALKLLVDELEKIEEPTILVFWGDHLPYLEDVYSETGYGDEDPSVNTKMYSETPLLLYSNFDIEKQDLKTISPFYLAPIVYEASGLEKPAFYNLLDQLRNEISAIKGSVKIDRDQQFIDDLTKKQQELLTDYQLLQYDLLMGKQYSTEILFGENKTIEK